jgi:hypothetical protein
MLLWSRGALLAFTLFGSAGPSNIPPDDSFVSLFNGIDFQGWLADPATLAHWKVSEGTLIADGGGPNLITENLYRDFELRLDFKVTKGASGGIFLRGRPRVVIGDPESPEPTTGGLSENKENPDKPSVKADRPAGEWNTFRIELVGNIATVYLNDQQVVEKVVMENEFDRSRRIPTLGPIELQANGPITFRNIFLRPLAGESASP